MDWTDIALHALGAIVFVGLIGLWYPKTALLVNTVFWPAREIVQHSGIPNSLQSTFEYIVPLLLGWLVFELVQVDYREPNEYDTWDGE